MKSDERCPRRFDPDDERCVPGCPRFLECYNEMQRAAQRKEES